MLAPSIPQHSYLGDMLILKFADTGHVAVLLKMCVPA